jgi:hypothetical protein
MFTIAPCETSVLPASAVRRATQPPANTRPDLLQELLQRMQASVNVLQVLRHYNLQRVSMPPASSA